MAQEWLVKAEEAARAGDQYGATKAAYEVLARSAILARVDPNEARKLRTRALTAAFDRRTVAP